MYLHRDIDGAIVFAPLTWPIFERKELREAFPDLLENAREEMIRDGWVETYPPKKAIRRTV